MREEGSSKTWHNYLRYTGRIDNALDIIIWIPIASILGLQFQAPLQLGFYRHLQQPFPYLTHLMG
uniref:Uncharacterized protein n=1 Tax=Rhizophora mucronata TaxID=61149 RepID=A0A2P2KAX2_RHIMU